MPRRLIALCFVLMAILRVQSVSGQPIGLMGFLDPEGSRLFPSTTVVPRHAGKPDPRWRAFSWRFHDSRVDATSFRFYFYEEEDWAARFALPKIEEQVLSLSKIFGYHPARRFNYLLFTSLWEFRQANAFFIHEGVQGITSTQEATMAIPYTGHTDFFDHVSTHELIHQFQVQKAASVSGTSAIAALAIFPLWFIEGMAEYFSLDGMDAESRAYLRDVLVHPDKSRDHEIPRFFESGPLNFVMVYKIGQAKVDFLEKRFGEGTAQRIFEAGSRAGRSAGWFDVSDFKETVEAVVRMGEDQIEKEWQTYLAKHRTEAGKLVQGFDRFEEIEPVGDTLDHFVISPNGDWLAIREVDPLTGVTSISLIDRKRENRKISIVRDRETDVLSLFFMQIPVIALDDDRIAYVVQSAEGPELEVRALSRRDGTGDVSIGPPRRYTLHKAGLIQASSPTFAPLRKERGRDRIALLGLSPDGWENVHVLDLKTGDIRRVTEGYYGWKSIHWGENGLILGSSNRTARARFNLFEVDPESGRTRQTSASSSDQLAPRWANRGMVFQSDRTGVPQIFLARRGADHALRLTEAKTLVREPVLREDGLYVLGLRGGRFRLFKLPRDRFISRTVSLDGDASGEPWKAKLVDFEDREVKGYSPFVSSGVRIDSLGGFLSTGGIIGVSGAASDLMRDYQVQTQFIMIGDIALSNALLTLSSQRGRSTWTLGGYHIAQPKVNSAEIDVDNGMVRTYTHREYGVVGAVQYPLSTASFLDLSLRMGGVDRRDGKDIPGPEFMLAPTIRLGSDKILFEAFTGPLSGYSLLAEVQADYFPKRSVVNERVRLDGSQYFQIYKRWVLALRGMAGGAFGKSYINSFFLGSDYILRAYPFGDIRLFGDYLLAAKAETRFPIGELFGFPPLRGTISLDGGSIFNRDSELGSKFTASYSGGISFNIPPIAMEFLLSDPLRVAPGPDVNSPVFHFTLRYLYF